MKTISDYTTPCTEEQTKMALELGAPIEVKYGSINHKPSIEDLQYLTQYDNIWYKIPTAEQMRGWLMDKIGATTFANSYYPVWGGYGYIIIGRFGVLGRDASDKGKNLLRSDKEATLAAIDAALEYLSNSKK